MVTGFRQPLSVALVFAGYTVIATVVTWPLASLTGSEIAGDLLDPVQTLWGFWWWRHSWEFSHFPFHSHLLWWPAGVPLWFQTWDIPAALVTLPLWGLAADTALYNGALFASFPLSGLTFYLLCRSRWGGHLGPSLAGSLYTFSTYHYAASTATLHIASMQWSPLYFLGLSMIAARSPIRGCVVAGIGLALAAVTSIYHLTFCMVATAIMIILHARRHGIDELTGRWRTHLGLFVAVFLLLAGWLLVGMVRSYFEEPYAGSHSPVVFASDLQAFVLPNPVSRWSVYFPVSKEWSGATWASGAYCGYVTLTLALVGLRRVAGTTVYMVIAATGAVLALGPFLHIGGLIYSQVLLPCGWLLALVPGAGFGGIVSRFSWLTTFGLCMCAGATLTLLCGWGLRGSAIAIFITVLALIETWPMSFPVANLLRPAVMATWAEDARDWAVLDASSGSKPLWHQMIHRHAIVDGYVTRVPTRLSGALWSDPVLRSFFLSAQTWDLRSSPGRLRGVLMAVTVPPQEGPVPSIDPVLARSHLRTLRIRYVILESTRTRVADAYGLREWYRGEGLVVYDIPH